MTDKTFTFHEDPGHGWLEVTDADLWDLGLSPASFSAYSYRSSDGTRFYLEEDCDCMRFITPWEKRNGLKIEPKIVTHRGECFIRALRSIK